MKTLIHRITFEESTRSTVEISDSSVVRMLTGIAENFENEYFIGCVTLKSLTDNPNNEYLQTELYNPQAINLWRAFEITVDEPDGDDTNFLFRIVNGNDDIFYWDGAQWNAATLPAHWNTRSEIQENFAAFPIDKTGVAFRIAPKALGTELPRLFSIKVAWDGEIFQVENVLINTLVPLLKAIESIGDIAQVTMETTGTTVGFDPEQLLPDMNFTGISSVYNHTDDPKHTANLFDSYDGGTKEITLTTSVNIGKELFVRFKYTPEVQISANQDYYEVARWPTVTIEDFNSVNDLRILFSEFITTQWTPVRKGLRVKAYRQIDFHIRLNVTTTLNVGQARLSESVEDALHAAKVIRLIDTDERADLIIVDPYRSKFEAQRSDLRGGEINLQILRIPFWEAESEEVYYTKEFITTYRSNGNEETIVVD